MTSLNLKKFDISSIRKDATIVVIGKRASGKSFFVRDLLYHKRDMPIGTVISASESSNRFYGDMCPSLFIHDEYSHEVLANLLKRQKLVTKKMKQQVAMYGKSNIDPYAFLILDDLMYDSQRWIKDISVRDIFMNGRHFNLMFLITMQFPLGIPPAFRTNVDLIVIFREPIMSNRRRLYEHYAGMFPTFEIFCQVMNQCTENYECLVINNRVSSNILSDQVSWYRSESHPPFKIGAPEFWQYHSNNYSEGGGDEEEDDIDINSIKKNKNAITVSVKKTY
jgi:hypothetical protein